MMDLNSKVFGGCHGFSTFQSGSGDGKARASSVLTGLEISSIFLLLFSSIDFAFFYSILNLTLDFQTRHLFWPQLQHNIQIFFFNELTCLCLVMAQLSIYFLTNLFLLFCFLFQSCFSTLVTRKASWKIKDFGKNTYKTQMYYDTIKNDSACSTDLP